MWVGRGIYCYMRLRVRNLQLHVGGERNLLLHAGEGEEFTVKCE